MNRPKTLLAVAAIALCLAQRVEAQVGHDPICEHRQPPRSTAPVVPVLPTAGLALSVGAAQQDWPYPEGPLQPLQVRVHAVFLSDDDGTKAVNITPELVSQWVAEANLIWESAGIELLFDASPTSGDHELLASTLLNSMTGVEHPLWPQQKLLADSIAGLTPEKMVVFFRWGPGASPAGNGFSWTDYDFIAAPGFFDTSVCGVQNIGLFAHEVGHYLGLPHTFSNIFSTVADAEAFFVANGSDPGVFEGDGRDDTLPDPYNDEIQCTPSVQEVTLAGTTLPLSRFNTMSYYFPDLEVSESQGWTARQVLALRSGQPVDDLVPGVAFRREGEGSAFVTGGWTVNQPMGGFLGRWSGDTHLFWNLPQPGDTLTRYITVPEAGYYDVYASFTGASDYGIFAHTLNGAPLARVNLYASIVLPTGPLHMGRVFLDQGANAWVATVDGIDPRAPGLGYAYGLDYLLFAPADGAPGEAYCSGDGSGASCPCGGVTTAGQGCLNSSGAGGAVLEAGGNASLSGDTFELRITGVPGAKPGIVLRGANQVNGGAGNPVGEGLLCASGQTARSSVKVTTPAGSAIYTEFRPGESFGSTSYGAGAVTNYQFWYRDTANTCNGAGFNFTNGWTVTWQN